MSRRPLAELAEGADSVERVVLAGGADWAVAVASVAEVVVGRVARADQAVAAVWEAEAAPVLGAAMGHPEWLSGSG